ncbi:invasion associated locus B family protein [Shimia sp. R10_1]|uniref:invasion associated locus B family protein n=1 Tax=Shimia sp. R10_1 TaxID=2821095 RepID=UPI001ADCCAD2|nr:invasion associated locus B family protein [Shimia sp. R10_1]MBO9472389.1 invasion associated locus B family protein [Shimia sp. R10_1]
MLKLPTLFAALPAMLVASQLSAQSVPSLSDGSLAMGEAVAGQGEAQIPQNPNEDITTETIGDWELQCAATGPEPRPCRMYQLLRDETGNPISEVTLFKLPQADGQAVAGATLIVPLETLLTAQLTMAVDGNNARRYPFAFCNQAGCIARIGFSQADISNFKSGNEAKISIVPALAPDQTVTVSMSLAGFTKAFDTAGSAGE